MANVSVPTSGGTTTTIATKTITSEGVLAEAQRNILVHGSANADALVATPFPVNAALRTDVLQSGETQLTPKFKTLQIAASQTDAPVVAAVATKKIRVLALVVNNAGTVGTITFESNGASDTALTQAIEVPADQTLTLPFNPVGWFETVVSEDLIATTSSGITANINLVYAEV